MQPIKQADITGILQAFEQSEFASLHLSFGSVCMAVSRPGLAFVSDAVINLADASPVRAPVLGILRANSATGPFVKVATAVEPDTVVGVLCVLDTTTEVRAGVRGTVVAAPVQDGELVEFGQPIVYIRETAQ